jgi:hypothetical protein
MNLGSEARVDPRRIGALLQLALEKALMTLNRFEDQQLHRLDLRCGLRGCQRSDQRAIAVHGPAHILEAACAQIAQGLHAQHGALVRPREQL